MIQTAFQSETANLTPIPSLLTISMDNSTNLLYHCQDPFPYTSPPRTLCGNKTLDQLCHHKSVHPAQLWREPDNRFEDRVEEGCGVYQLRLVKGGLHVYAQDR